MEEITRNELIAVGTSSVQISPRFPGREIVYIRNTSTESQRITIVMGFKVAVDYEGIPLNPGETLTDANSEAYECWKGVITAISSAADGQLSIYER